MRAANQPRFSGGSHSPASRSDFWRRFTVGSAIVRLSMSPAKSVRNCDSARPESYASASATMCSISVAAVPSALISNNVQVYGVYTCPSDLGCASMISSSSELYAEPNASGPQLTRHLPRRLASPSTSVTRLDTRRSFVGGVWSNRLWARNRLDLSQDFHFDPGTATVYTHAARIPRLSALNPAHQLRRQAPKPVRPLTDVDGTG